MRLTERTKIASFAITSAWEGGLGYADYQTYDAGVISYGRFQFTLASGSLSLVLDRYLKRASGELAAGLAAYADRCRAKDATLRGDARFRELLVAASAEDDMRDVQDEIASETYWTPAMASADERNIRTPLGKALLFDMAIQHGPRHRHLAKAESSLGLAHKTKLPSEGVTERDLIARLAQIRQTFLYNFAAYNNLPGVKKRGDFWVALVEADDWYLLGDDRGNVTIYGLPVQIREPDPQRSKSGELVDAEDDDVEPEEDDAAAGAEGSGDDEDDASGAEEREESSADDGESTGLQEPEPGRPINAMLDLDRDAAVYAEPDVDSAKVRTLPAGSVVRVTRRYAPKHSEEWLRVDGGWLARRHPNWPDQVFGLLRIETRRPWDA